MGKNDLNTWIVFQNSTRKVSEIEEIGIKECSSGRKRGTGFVWSAASEINERRRFILFRKSNWTSRYSQIKRGICLYGSKVIISDLNFGRIVAFNHRSRPIYIMDFSPNLYHEWDLKNIQKSSLGVTFSRWKIRGYQVLLGKMFITRANRDCVFGGDFFCCGKTIDDKIFSTANCRFTHFKITVETAMTSFMCWYKKYVQTLFFSFKNVSLRHGFHLIQVKKKYFSHLLHTGRD